MTSTPPEPTTVTDDPFVLFENWYAEAHASEPGVPDAMTLATVDAQGRPSARMVLLKGHGPDGFVFYTNLESEKAREIAGNPHAALLFHWKSRAPPASSTMLRPTPISRRARAIRRSVPGHPTSRARSTAARPSSAVSRRRKRALPAARCRARRTGPVIG
jgi:hypothetical protein